MFTRHTQRWRRFCICCRKGRTVRLWRYLAKQSRSSKWQICHLSVRGTSVCLLWYGNWRWGLDGKKTYCFFIVHFSFSVFLLNTFKMLDSQPVRLKCLLVFAENKSSELTQTFVECFYRNLWMFTTRINTRLMETVTSLQSYIMIVSFLGPALNNEIKWLFLPV